MAKTKGQRIQGNAEIMDINYEERGPGMTRIYVFKMLATGQNFEWLVDTEQFMAGQILHVDAFLYDTGRVRRVKINGVTGLDYKTPKSHHTWWWKIAPRIKSLNH